MKTYFKLLTFFPSIALTSIHLHGAIHPEVSAGPYHSLFLKSDKTAWSTGANWGGQLGDGTFDDRNTPFHVLSDVVAISAGETHSLFVKSDGTVWAAGAGNDGRLGDGSSQDKNTSVQVQISGVKDVAAGNDFSLFLKFDGTVWGCGNTGAGQLGLTQYPYPTVPVQIPIENVTAIAAGFRHSLFLKQNGEVWATGANGGALGDGTSNISYTPKQVATQCKGFAADGSQTGYHSLFLKSDGTARSTGNNRWGQLGDGTTDNRYSPVGVLVNGPIRSVAAGADQSFFLKDDLTVWSCGFNARGELGVFGSGGWVATPFQVMDKTVAVSSGLNYSLFLKADGSVWASGINNRGTLGDGTWTDRGTPVQIMSLGIMLDATGTDGGTVTGSGPFDLNETVMASASPNLGYLFTGWSGDVTGTVNPVSLTMDTSKAIKATFERNLTDIDQDGLTFYDEVVVHGTNPSLEDTDEDGFNDGFELSTGFNPTSSSSTPDALSSIRTAVEFRFNAAKDVSYRIEASTDLNQWDVIEPVIVGQSAVVTRFYSIENQPKRYFRVRRN
jgi:alpha-tubulin suppressor-like RCC1 family protein